jgi:transcriptional regulator with XRE-family HTH domain
MNGKELRGIRKRLGLTQKQLAKEAAVTSNTVARWERDEVAIRESMARLIQSIAKSRGKKKR